MEASLQLPPEVKPSQGSRSMVAPQASPIPLWPLSVVCHLLVWPVQCIVYTCRWNRFQGARDAIASLVDPTRSTVIRDGVCADTLETYGTVVFAGLLKPIRFRPRYQDFGFAHVDLKSLSFHARLPEDQALLWFLQRWWPAYRFFPGISCPKLLGEGPRPVGGPGKSIDKPPLSIWTLHSCCKQHAFCFWHFQTLYGVR